MKVSPRGFAVALALAACVLAALTLWSIGTGRFPLPLADVARALWAALTGTPSGLPANAEAIVLQVRGPRVLAALAVGAGLAAAGAAYQSLFRNPLASPDLLGVSSGCALGAGIAVLLGLGAAWVQAWAFAGGLAASALVVGVSAWLRGRDPLVTLILTGVVVGSLFGAGVAFVKYVADPFDELPAISFWLLGSFASVEADALRSALLPLAAGLAPLVLLRARIDLLALSDDEAASLGVAPARLRLAVVAAATLATAAAVSLAGVIGWVGLVVPHAARLVAGAPFARVLPLAMLIGAGFLLLVDTLCRSAFATEVPPGAVTAVLGAPAFIALLASSLGRRR